jgi:hypothetical protein
MVIHNQSGAPLIGQKGPDPLQQDAQPQARRSQKLDVHERPYQPSRKSTNLYFAALQYGKSLAYDGHVSLVEVGE